ncbi:uncharacterized protein MEPE_06119 [Melanopsichium pennsylvanicum]|uniref:Uncharacterized protein n=1 Tax=Melanopsichium pennsylvanicum TaxID=63383 RepID=A0AAJ4XRX1_9BASI|nr:uncharacterized protein MEPE_06119 [Melanopsichium pennsylvanicum]
MKEAFSTPLQGQDALRIVLQILSFQTLHYLILATLVPPMLAIFADTESLMFEGGPTQIGMIFDWRQIAGRPTFDWKLNTDNEGKGGQGSWSWTNLMNVYSSQQQQDKEQDKQEKGEIMWKSVGEESKDVVVNWNLDNVWLDNKENNDEEQDDDNDGGFGGKVNVLDHEQVIRFKMNFGVPFSVSNTSLLSSGGNYQVNSTSGTSTIEMVMQRWEWAHTIDVGRSVTIIFSLFLILPIDVVLLVYLVRRPRYMLDHGVSFHVLNFFVSLWYSGEIPKGMRWWMVMMVHASIMVIWSEQLAIKRELNRTIGYSLIGSNHPEQQHQQQQQQTNVLFDFTSQQHHDQLVEHIQLKPM